MDRLHSCYATLAAECEDNSLSAVQLAMYDASYSADAPEGEDDPSQDPSVMEADVIAPFLYERKYFTHAPYGRELLTVSHSGETDTATYSANMRYHKLMNIYLTWRPPAIRVRDEWHGLVEVAWTPNLFHNLISVMTWVLGKDVHRQFDQPLNSYALDEALSSDPKHDMLSYMIGNRESLVEWSHTLSTNEDLVLPCPFSFTHTEKYAIPLHLMDANTSALFVIKYVRNITSLLRMRVRRTLTDDWSYLHASDVDLSLLAIDRPDDARKVDIPAMWGEYAMISEDQMEAEANASAYGKYILPITERVPGQEVVLAPGADRERLVLEHPMPVRMIVYSFRNMLAKAMNNHSNYTTNPYDASRGMGPLSAAEIRHGALSRVPLTDAAHWSLASYYRYSRQTSPPPVGFYMYSFGYHPFSYHPDESCNMGQGRHMLMVQVQPYTLSVPYTTQLGQSYHIGPMSHRLPPPPTTLPHGGSRGSVHHWQEDGSPSLLAGATEDNVDSKVTQAKSKPTHTLTQEHLDRLITSSQVRFAQLSSYSYALVMCYVVYRPLQYVAGVVR